MLPHKRLKLLVFTVFEAASTHTNISITCKHNLPFLWPQSLPVVLCKFPPQNHHRESLYIYLLNLQVKNSCQTKSNFDKWHLDHRWERLLKVNPLSLSKPLHNQPSFVPWFEEFSSCFTLKSHLFFNAFFPCGNFTSSKVWLPCRDFISFFIASIHFSLCTSFIALS